MSQIFERLVPYLEKHMALQTALALLDWDDATLAPKEAGEYTAKVIGILSQEDFVCLMNPQVKKILEELETDKTMDSTEQAIFRKVRKQFRKNEAIPKEEKRAYAELKARSQKAWEEAKKEQDFSIFAPYLEKMIAYGKKFAAYGASDGQEGYDVLLDDYEEAFPVEVLDSFFEKLKKEIIPLLRKIQQQPPIDDSFLYLEYDVEKQKEFNRFLAEYVGFDWNRGVMAESAHPFTTSWHNHDVRITTHYYKNQLASAIFSTIHESGHAIYEQGIEDCYTQTVLGEGASCGIHESQSRFMENIIGRSRAFWIPIYKKLVETFPEQLGEVSLDRFVAAINRVKADEIRTEADELTYCLHIMVRYEIEKMMINEEVSVEELPKIWNEKYQEYLGVTPENDAVGILQDVHWSMGDIGYFPSYALGNAFAAQIYARMKKEMDVEAELSAGNIGAIRDFLHRTVHRYGALKEAREILLDATGEEFNPDYFIEYLKEKYQKIYGIS